MRLLQLIYASTRVGTFGLQDARSVIDAAKRRNVPQDITGLLIYADGYFLQVLEGSASATSETFIRIGADPRHEHISLLSVEDVAERSFPQWAMRYIDVSELRDHLIRFNATGLFRPHGMTGQRALGFAKAVAMHQAAQKAA